MLLNDRPASTDWSFIQAAPPEEAATKISEIVLNLAGEIIGKRTLAEKKSTHPWLTERAVAAVAARDAADGTGGEPEAIIECSRVLKEEREAYIDKTKRDLVRMNPSSKLWWAKARELLGDEAKVCNIPALKTDDGEWIIDPKGKADLLANICGKVQVLRMRKSIDSHSFRATPTYSGT